MNTITISPKYQIVIPKNIRQMMKLTPGMKIQMVTYDNRLELIPILPIKSLKGFLKGMDTNIERDQDRY